ncbi:MAG: hypothetical protein HY820_42405 [Acidobacteria bacterium]|nr:hypothetical protein [Acidobacteriota bacterium]
MIRTSLLLSMAVLSLAAFTVAAKATFTIILGTEQGIALTEGVVNCQGGVAPTGNLFVQPCPPGVRGTVRGRTLVALERANPPDPKFDGTNTITANINFGPDGKGNMWGTYRSVLGAGGVWEGTFTGNIDVNTLVYDFKTVGHGQSGPVDGLQSKCEGYPSAVPGVNNTICRILDPGKN